MEKLYERQIFEDDTAPDLSATNVNIWTKAIDEIDTRVCEILPADDYLELSKQTKEAAEEAKEAAERAHTTEVIVSPLVTEGTHIADISVNGHPTELYAPTGGGGVSASINGIPLVGNKTDAELGLASAEQLTASDNLKFRFATDGEGNYGYLGADDSFIPFKAGGDAVFVPMYIPNGSARTTDVYTNNSGKDVTIYYCVRSGASGSGSSPYARISVDGTTIVSLTSLTTLYEGSVSVPNGSTLQVYTNTNIYFIGSFSSLPFEKNVPIEDHVPSKEGAIIEQIYSESVKQSTGLTFTPDENVRAFAICDANIVYAFATTDMTVKRLYNNNGIISLTKNANGSFTLKWTSQYTSTVALTVFGIK